MQISDGETKRRYRELLIQSADHYLASDPDMSERPWPLEIGTVVFLQLAAHAVTERPDYLDRAKQVSSTVPCAGDAGCLDRGHLAATVVRAEDPSFRAIN